MREAADRGGHLRGRPRADGRRVRRGSAAVGRRPDDRDIADRVAGGSGVRPATRSHGLARGLRHRRSPARRSTSTPGSIGDWSTTNTPTCTGGSPSSSPRRRWNDGVATGGRRTDERMLVCRVDERPVQTWHIAQPDRSGRRATGGSLPASGDRQRDRHAARAWGWTVLASRWSGIARRSSTWPPCRGRRKARRSPWCNRATSAPCTCWRSIRTTGETELVWKDQRRDLDAHHPRGPGVAPRRTAAHGGPSRRHAPVAGRRRTRHARGTAGRFGDRRERRRGVPRHRGAHRDARVAPVGRWFPRAGSRMAPGSTARRWAAISPSWCPRPIDEPFPVVTASRDGEVVHTFESVR